MIPVSYVMALMMAIGTADRGHALGISMAAGSKFEASVLVVTGWEEGRWCYGCAHGDNGRACSTYQIHARTPAQCVQLERDPIYAARYAVWLIRKSAALCPDAPLAPYAGGCGNKWARIISDRRMMLADVLMELVEPD